METTATSNVLRLVGASNPWAGTSEDEDSFVDAANEHVATMLRLARRRSSGNAEDIVQEALSRAWAKRRHFDPARGTFRSWLLAITADAAYKDWRWSFRHNRVVQQEDREVTYQDEWIDLKKSIDGLPPRQRLAVDCFYFAGLSVTETAVVMGCSEGTVKSTLASARRRLRERLGWEE